MLSTADKTYTLNTTRRGPVRVSPPTLDDFDGTIATISYVDDDGRQVTERSIVTAPIADK